MELRKKSPEEKIFLNLIVCPIDDVDLLLRVELLELGVEFEVLRTPPLDDYVRMPVVIW